MARRRGKYTPDDVEQVTLLRANGLDWEQISENLGLRVSQCEAAYEAGKDGPDGVDRSNRLLQIFEKLQERLVFTINSFTDQEIRELKPAQRAILFGIMADKIAPLRKVLVERLGADHLEKAPGIRQMLAGAPEDLALLSQTAERLRKKALVPPEPEAESIADVEIAPDDEIADDVEE